MQKYVLNLLKSPKVVLKKKYSHMLAFKTMLAFLRSLYRQRSQK